MLWWAYKFVIATKSCVKAEIKLTGHGISKTVPPNDSLDCACNGQHVCLQATKRQQMTVVAGQNDRGQIHSPST
jgi:hypothetical protein